MGNLKTVKANIGIGKTWVDLPVTAFQTVIAVHREGSQYYLVDAIPVGTTELFVYHDQATGRLYFPPDSGYTPKSRVFVIYRA